MASAGVGTITIGTDLESSRQVVELANKHSNVWACIGLHPNEADEDFDAAKYKELLSGDAVAVGECGLDYFRGGADGEFGKERQQHNFRAQIEFAIGHDLPLMMHIRSSEGTTDAHDDVLEILYEYKAEHGEKLRMHSHFTTFGPELGQRFLEIGATFGIPGVVTYKSAPELQELVKMLPLENMVVETDAPYAAPVPHRGKRNEPKFVIDIVAYIAELREGNEEVVQKQLLENSKKIFNL
jgi:TatD DNase family protein